MGNNQPKYLNSNEAMTIIGDKTWDRLRRQLRSSNHGNGSNRNSMDFSFFDRIIKSHFDYIPKLLLESLFLGFASDINSRIDIDEFISSLAVIHGQNKPMILRFLFRIYDCRGSGHIERLHVERVLKAAYPYRNPGDVESAKRGLDLLFRANVGGDTTVPTHSLTLREFETAAVPIRELGEWVQAVLRIFTDPLPSRLLSIDRRYCSNITNAEIMAKYSQRVTELQCTSICAIFINKCNQAIKTQQSLSKHELNLESWIHICKYFLPTSLASMVFLVSMTSLKPIWRLEEFVDFCFVFGRGSIEEQAMFLISCSHRYYRRQSSSHDERTVKEIGTWTTFFKRVILILAQSNGSDNNTISSDDTESSKETSSRKSNTESSSNDAKGTGYYLPKVEALETSIFLPATIREELDELEKQVQTEFNLHCYVDVVVKNSGYLPGLRDLSIAACCLFGVQPVDPAKEKEFVMELMVRMHAQAPQTRIQPYGPVGTEWCVVVKSWWENWRLYVGHIRISIATTSPTSASASFGVSSTASVQFQSNGYSGQTLPQNSSSSSNFMNNMANNMSVSPKHPGEIDNWSILKKSGPKQLLPGITLHNDIEIISPQVYQALQMWYGGGPRILRKVITTMIDNVKATELELFPLCLKIATCLPDGRTREPDRDLIISRMLKISEIIRDIANNRNIDSTRIRLWNYANGFWKDQIVLNPDLTFEEANLQDGQTIILEISLNDGTWPISQLHAQLDEEERMKQQVLDVKQAKGKNKQQNVVTVQPNSDVNSLVTEAVKKLNDGRIGLDNLGNTCYMNASLQALLHTEPLVDYFLSKNHLLDINRDSKFGYGGRLAMSFGKLVEELYRSNRKNINPRHFVNDVASIHQQFSGNQQQDAQELLAFLLDGLSEDLNLVDEKPYTMQPDSDGRPDEELANIWWENHLKRDLSLIQALFTGQFKSMMTCSCGHTSARFEPFNILTVPIPEDFMRMFAVHVVFDESPFALLLTVRVDKRSDLNSVIDVINKLNLSRAMRTGKGETSDEEEAPINRRFIAVEIVNSRIETMLSLDKKLDMIRDEDNIFLYETKRKHKGMTRGQRPLLLPVPNDPYFDYNATATSPKSQNSEKLKNPNTDRRNIAEGGSMEMSPSSGTQLSETLEDPSQNSPQDKSEPGVRVAFIQRRIRLDSSKGIDSFTLDIFGLPFVHVLDPQMSGKKLYDLIFASVKSYLKADIADLKDHYAQSSLKKYDPNEHSDVVVVGKPVEGPTNRNNSGSVDDIHVVAKAIPSNDIPANATDKIRSASNEEVFSGPISRTGFTLRLILGGSQFCKGCVRCHWLARCQGCVIPDNDSVLMNIRDGETIAIDWHIAVFEELLDISAAAEVRRHQSSSNRLLQDYGTPLQRCLDKFTEEEPLEGMTCPKCHNDDKLRKSFNIWRLPPVLVVQLKRFQFDNTSRRKLTNRVDFPLEDLDLSPYMAATISGKDEDKQNELPENSLPDHHMYDLYCTVHHIGALGGGHYVTTVKHNNIQHFSDDTSSSTTTDISTDQSKASKPSSSWWLYNDDVTSEIKELRELCGPSAYLLFYIRKDVQNAHLTSQDLFSPFREKAPPRSKTLQSAGSSPNDSRVISKGKASNKVLYNFSKIIPRPRSHSSASAQSKDSTASTSSVAVSEGGIVSHKTKSKFLRSTSMDKRKQGNGNPMIQTQGENGGCMPS